MTVYKCANCESTSTYVSKDGYHRWTMTDNGLLCQKCYNKLVSNPSRSYEYQRKYNIVNGKRRIKFKGKIVPTEINPRKGECLKCHKKIGDEYINCKGQVAIIKQTHLHHIEYHTDNVLKDTFELCASCHGKEI